MDADGDFDIVIATGRKVVSWYENDGSESPSFSLHNTAVEAQAAFTSDINGDGIQELLSVQNDTIFWFSTTQRSVLHEAGTLMVQLTETATDEDGNTLTYEIIGGADKLLFSIDSATVELNFLVAPVFGTPSDANEDEIYEVLISVSDGFSTLNRFIAVEVVAP